MGKVSAMECKKCGKIIDPRHDSKFCTGCGASIVPESVSVKKGPEGEKSRIVFSPVTLKEMEIETRARALVVGAFFGFFACLTFLSILGYSQLTGFIISIPIGAVFAVIFMLAISKSSPDIKEIFNEKLAFIPTGEKLKKLSENLSESILSFAPLPGGKDDNGKKVK